LLAVEMPLYEEKFISPLAVRFTQDHIRPVFQNGTDLNRTIREIKATPGSGDYDVILEAPFEAIEIIRWHKRDASGEEADGRHWFTFDNRRLYCLQRAAAALWPKKVGAIVQALYAASDGCQRKDNSTTAGRAVGIGHSPKLLTDRWDWREVVAAGDGASAWELVQRDDQLPGVADLPDAPVPPSMLELLLQGLGEKPRSFSEAVSTTDERSSGSEGPCDDADTPAAVVGGLCGQWRSARKSQGYEVRAEGQKLVCVSPDGRGGQRRVVLLVDEQRDVVWWGDEKMIFAQAGEVCGQRGQLTWYCDDGAWTPKMTWRWVGEADAQPKASPGAQGAPSSSRRRRGARRA